MQQQCFFYKTEEDPAEKNAFMGNQHSNIFMLLLINSLLFISNM